MSRSFYLASRLREVLLSGKWIANTNCLDQIQDLDWQKATRKVHDLNSIALLIFHLNYYLGGLLSVLHGGQLEIKDAYSFDMLPILSEEDWQGMFKTFVQNAEQFSALVEMLPDDLLDKPFTNEKYGSYMRNIECVIEHSYYHLGQIVLIRKILESGGM